ncbi:DeoR/GlpR family DNA-binding transcription regulator [Rhizobium tumorigenes]|uniref:DeoR/GlpR family DNA-binding transcription regulator n=1 Tax=Rhizobium tumorigenes TaxID=2041385 RepID=UPI00241CC4B5|nr:DeoR/GlpR family DNA-binding transcription regulator [Rhizobium tumorigenes]WFS03614.1 DeoR/GlpR family DNA-binding transcription regulator [Rhizobium tumorigenes]
MLTDERLDRIREKLMANGKVLANELAVDFEVSEDTVRRDLRELAKLGFCRRVYGGALLPTPDFGTLANRTGLHQDRKSSLARAAAALIEDGQTIFIDAGSTNLAIANALDQSQRLTIVTNAPVIATALSDRPNYTILVLGGMYDQGKGACLGPQAVREATQVFADIFIIGVCGVDSTVGVTALDAGEAELKRTMVSQSNILLVAATAEKLGTVAPFKVADASMIDHLIVENGDCDVRDFAMADVQVHVASDAAVAAS